MSYTSDYTGAEIDGGILKTTFITVTGNIDLDDVMTKTVYDPNSTAGDVFNSANIDYDGTTSGLAATNVQDAIDEVDSDLDAHKADYATLSDTVDDHESRIDTIEWDLSKNKELLQHSNKYAALGKIAPTIAHEIRNPLASIKMLVYSIGEEENMPVSVKEDLNINRILHKKNDDEC